MNWNTQTTNLWWRDKSNNRRHPSERKVKNIVCMTRTKLQVKQVTILDLCVSSWRRGQAKNRHTQPERRRWIDTHKPQTCEWTHKKPVRTQTKKRETSRRKKSKNIVRMNRSQWQVEKNKSGDVIHCFCHCPVILAQGRKTDTQPVRRGWMDTQKPQTFGEGTDQKTGDITEKEQQKTLSKQSQETSLTVSVIVQWVACEWTHTQTCEGSDETNRSQHSEKWTQVSCKLKQNESGDALVVGVGF